MFNTSDRLKMYDFKRDNLLKCYKRSDSDTIVAKLFVAYYNETSVWLRCIPHR